MQEARHFSVFVELLNLRVRSRRPVRLHERYAEEEG